MAKGQKVISGLYRDTAILTMHNFELEVLPQVAFKLPKTTDKVLILDKLMLVQIGKNTLKLVSAHHAEITIINTVDYNKTKEDPVMQTFVLPRSSSSHVFTIPESTKTFHISFTKFS